MKLKLLSVCVFLFVLLIAGTSIAPAKGGSECDQDPDCILLEDPGNSGTYTAPDTIEKVVIKAGVNYFTFFPGTTNDGCYSVTIAGNTVTWEKVGSGSNCKDISHIQVWLGTAPPPPPPVGCEVFTSCEEVTLVVGHQHESCEGWTLMVWLDGAFVGSATTDSSCTTTVAAGAQNGQTVSWEVWDADGMKRRWGSFVCQAD